MSGTVQNLGTHAACITSSDSDRAWTYVQATVLNKIE